MKTIHELCVVLGIMAAGTAYVSPKTWDTVAEVKAFVASLARGERTWHVAGHQYPLRGRYAGRDEFGQVRIALSASTARIPLSSFSAADQAWIEAQHDTSRR